MINKNIFWIYCSLILFLIITMSCGKGESIVYKELTPQGETIVIQTDDLPYVNSAVRIGERIFVVYDDIWLIDLHEGKERIIVKDGIGPNQVYKPSRIVKFDQNLYTKSLYQLNYFYRFSLDSEDFKIERVPLKNPLGFNDFEFISKDLVVMVNVYWEKGFVRIYNVKTGDCQNIGNSKISDLMLKFNVNSASLCYTDDKLYIVQGIKPEIMVVSPGKNKVMDSIELSPPFYKPMPEKYKVEKYDQKMHKKWMASWTRISDIMGKGKWLLLKYRWGYDHRYCYELIDIDDTGNRLYISESPNDIYDFEVKDGKIFFEAFEQLDEKILWKKVEAYF